MREIVIISLKILVPLAGLEPARSLLRGILSPNIPLKPQYIVISAMIKTLYIVAFLSLPIITQTKNVYFLRKKASKLDIQLVSTENNIP